MCLQNRNAQILPYRGAVMTCLCWPTRKVASQWLPSQKAMGFFNWIP